LVCDSCLLNPAVLVVSGLSGVLGALGRILLSYPVHMHSRLRSLRQGQVHVGPITWKVLPHTGSQSHGPNYSTLGPIGSPWVPDRRLGSQPPKGYRQSKSKSSIARRTVRKPTSTTSTSKQHYRGGAADLRPRPHQRRAQSRF
jgi:hypothetical protein